MTTPRRIQLSRAKGWRMPEGTVSVARPGRWGNPHTINRWRDRETCVALFRDSVLGCWSPSTSAHLPDAYAKGSYRDHHEWLRRIGGHPAELAPVELRGKHLACWCSLCPAHADGKPLGITCEACAPCHADVLLEIANR